MKKISDSSFVFTNAYTNYPWSNVVRYLDLIEPSLLLRSGYKALGSEANSIRKNHFENYLKQKLPANYYQRVPAEKHGDILKEVKSKLLQVQDQPFFLQLHFKFTHIPYFNRHHEDGMNFDNPNLRKRFEQHRRAFSQKKTLSPATIMLFEKLYYRKRPGHDRRSKVANFLFDQASIKRWQKSKYYEKDLEIIKLAYDSALAYFDASIKDLLNLYGNKNLQENTVILFVGDHGESHMEHNELFHSKFLYDQTLQFPMFVKFPETDVRKIIHKQFTQKSVYNIVEEILKGNLDNDNFSEFLENQVRDDLLFSRNCTNSIHSIRYNNEWKYILNLESDKQELYNLQKDPDELSNLAEQKPEQLAVMKEFYLSRTKKMIAPLFCIK